VSAPRPCARGGHPSARADAEALPCAQSNPSPHAVSPCPRRRVSAWIHRDLDAFLAEFSWISSRAERAIGRALTARAVHRVGARRARTSRRFLRIADPQQTSLRSPFMTPTKKSLVSLTILGIVFVANSATAESLAEKERWAREDHYVQPSLDAMNDACGIAKDKAITHSFNKKSFDKNPPPTSYSPNGHCGGLLDDIAYLCRNMEAAKQPIQENIKRITCTAGAKGKYSLTLKGGTLNYVLDWDQINTSDKNLETLKKML
jgi:hypothetical protein